MINDIGERIKKYRTSIKMTQKDFASRLGVTGASVSAYENGTRLPSYEILVKIANILGISTDMLLGRVKDAQETLNITDLTADQKEHLKRIVAIYKRYNALYDRLSPEMRSLFDIFIKTGDII